MSVAQDIGRRTVLRWLAGLGVTASVGRSRPGWGSAAPRSVTALIGCRASALVLGREYLRLRPDERDAGVLLAALGLDAEALDAGAESVRAKLRRRHQTDFRMGRLVDLRGWLLSETELRLCALACVGVPPYSRPTSP